MSVKFFALKGKTKLSTIYVRFWSGREYDFKTSTPIRVFYSQFSNAKQRMKLKADTKNKDLINSKLSGLEAHILDRWNEDILNQAPISKVWLNDVVNSFFGIADKTQAHKVYFVDWVENFIKQKQAHKGRTVKPHTLRNYATTLNKIRQFENYSKLRLRHRDINLSFYNDFIKYCLDVSKVSKNTAGRYTAMIKQFCKLIELDGLPINTQYKHPDFTTISSKTHDVYLTNDEINKVFAHDLSKSIALSNARDLFIIGLRTGLRISDFMRIEQTNIKEGFITVETVKTGQTVVIPMHPQIKAILKRNDSKLPYRISNQKFNRYIKEVCKEVGLNEPLQGSKMVNVNNDTTKPKKWRKQVGTYPKFELVTSHTCRRSFASNLYGKLPNLTIMAITGHKRETTFLNYIKVTPKENAERLQALYNKEQADTNTSNLKAVK